MCFVNKWRDFEATKQYLSIVSGLTSVTKLHLYSQRFKYIAEKGDHWCTPIEFMENGGGDCENWARWFVDVLVRVIGIDGARFIAYYAGFKGHAVCVFPYRGKYSIFSNSELLHGFANYVDIGHFFFPKLKRMVVRDWQGVILSKKRKWIGTF